MAYAVGWVCFQHYSLRCLFFAKQVNASLATGVENRNHISPILAICKI